MLTHCFGSSVRFVSVCEFISFTGARRSEWDSTKCFPYREFISFVSWQISFHILSVANILAVNHLTKSSKFEYHFV